MNRILYNGSLLIPEALAILKIFRIALVKWKSQSALYRYGYKPIVSFKENSEPFCKKECGFSGTRKLKLIRHSLFFQGVPELFSLRHYRVPVAKLSGKIVGLAAIYRLRRINCPV